MNPFHWLKTIVKAKAKAAFNEGMAEGVAEAAQEFASAIEGLSIEMPALVDKPKGRKTASQS